MSLLSCIRLPLLRAAGGPWTAQVVTAQGRRQASVKSQGAYKKKNKKSIPKKLGAKKTGDQFVIPGNILWRQRGTIWWPGENCFMGRDHTIHTKIAGYVKFYRDPLLHPDRKYIGVVFNREDKLPYPPHAVRKRRLGRAEHPRVMVTASTEKISPSGIPYEVRRVKPGEPDRLLRLRHNYSYREDNWRIGRLVKTTGIRAGRFRTRKQSYRYRRWMVERTRQGVRKSVIRRLEEGEDGMVVKAVSMKAEKRAARKAKQDRHLKQDKQTKQMKQDKQTQKKQMKKR
ncbi:hypothetical protein XA68_10743 [Ophiocordyceps unilateralis]|uniref:Large ribosomal subunit protein bL27m n=1 Tax=Ophiocordyceps unilateralis TaxID=268505 RepID=A0A2A9PID9_OPHUN|nr:hypothetical protein XA68_10743 [Ophiocordyceps unilateralis]